MVRPPVSLDVWVDRVRAALDAGRSAQALRLADRALSNLAGADPATLTRLHGNRAVAIAELGDVTQALGVVQDLLAHHQRDEWVQAAASLVLFRAGRLTEAIESATVVLDESTNGHLRMRTLLNRANHHLELGDLRSAQNDLRQAARIAATRGDRFVEFASTHNEGYLRFLSGDLPGALTAMADAADLMPGPELGVLLLDRARVLMAAGLMSEARTMAQRALESLEAERSPGDQAVALLLLAELRGRSGDVAGALSAARRARRIHRRRRTPVPELVATLTELRWILAAGGARSVRAVVSQSPALVAGLEAAGLTYDADWARLLWVEALIAAGDGASARTELAGLGKGRGRVDIAQELKRAALESALAPYPLRYRPLRRGLDRLGVFQAHLGAPELQAAASATGVELARAGLRQAVDSGSAAAVLQWLERSRAVTSRLPPITPPDDPELADLLSQVRLLSDQQREQRLAGKSDPVLARRITELHGTVRSRSWTVAGSGRPERPITLAEVERILAADPSKPTVVAYLTGRDAVWAVVITGRRGTFRRLGPWSEDPARHRRRHADLDLLAAQRIPLPLRTVARTSVDRELTALDEVLLGAVADLLDPGPLIIAAVGDLATVPWLLLPSAAGRPVTVHSSVTAALRAPRWTGPDHLRGVLAVAGPEVPTGESEVAAVVATHPGAVPLGGAGATGRAVLDAVPQGGLLHIAAHGHHEVESPLFSHVLLADGPLYGYDIAPNPTLPAQVVLSACDVGRSSLQPGNEPLGLAAALLRSGVDTVIAGVTRVSDEIAALTMVIYHRELVAGRSPAAALAAAVTQIRTREGELAAFTSFGSADLMTSS